MKQSISVYERRVARTLGEDRSTKRKMPCGVQTAGYHRAGKRGDTLSVVCTAHSGFIPGRKAARRRIHSWPRLIVLGGLGCEQGQVMTLLAFQSGLRTLKNSCLFPKISFQLMVVIGFVLKNHPKKSRSALSCAASVAARFLRVLR